MNNRHFAILLIVLFVCVVVFFYQLNYNVGTFIVINDTEVPENGTISGVLMDSFGQGVPNQTITFHEPGSDGSIIAVDTNENGEFKITDAVYLPDEGSGNYYGDFAFAGEGKYGACSYEGNITVTK